MNRRTRRWATGLIVIVIALVGMICSPVEAAKNDAQEQAPYEIPEDKRPWAGLPWIIGGVLSAGAVAVGFKNAKRTHLD